jgi:hypothetical protein
MVNVKIECGCGQHYAFEVQPVNGLMSSTVACPICGADGTAAANAVIASQIPPAVKRPQVRVTVPPARSSAARVAQVGPEPQPDAATSGVRVNARALGLVDRETAETEARAKISWGDSREEVMKYLMIQGFSAPEASDFVAELYKQRLAALRVKAIWKIITGLGMMCAPVIALLPMLHYRIISFQLLAVPVMIGLYGCWRALNGIITLAVPKMESGDVAE